MPEEQSDPDCCINHCDICDQCFNESHYHCGNCGEETGMFGHYDFDTHEFTCVSSNDPQ